MAENSGWLRDRGKPARRWLALTVALGELSGILFMLQTAVLVSIGDAAIMRGKEVRELLPLFAVFLGLIALRSVASWLSRRAAFECSSRVKKTIRAELVSCLHSMGPIALDASRSGELAHVVVDAVESLDSYYSGYLPQRAIAALLPFTILAAVFPLDWISALVLVLTAVFLPLSMIAIGTEAEERNQRLWSTLARLSGRFLDALRGLATVKMFGAARREAKEIEASSDEYRRGAMSVLRIAFVSSFMLELIAAVSIAIVAVLTGLRLLSGGMRFAPGYFILLVAPEYFLTLRTLGAQYHARMEAASAAEQIRALLDKAPRAGAAPEASDFSGAARKAARGAAVRSGGAAASGARGASVRFSDVRFAYADRPILDGVSFSVEAGERLAIVGPSGCGKSTLLGLILGFAAPSRGAVYLGGRDLALIDRGELYEDLAWLPQRPTIFRGSIRYNIGMGRPGAGDVDIRRAARSANVEEFSDRLESGLDTLVGEGGTALSSGQSQRVALARLFLRSPRLLLLDEPTAHLDAAGEALVRQSIAVLAAGRTLIVATHRPFPEADRCLDLGSIGAWQPSAAVDA